MSREPRAGWADKFFLFVRRKQRLTDMFGGPLAEELNAATIGLAWLKIAMLLVVAESELRNARDIQRCSIPAT